MAIQSRAQWERMQQMIPVEDRVSYEDYLATSGTRGLTSAEERLFGTLDSEIAPQPVTPQQVGPRMPKGIAGADVAITPGGQINLTPTGGGTFDRMPGGGLTPSLFTGSGTTADPLIYKGSPYTGERNGAKYVNGVLKTDSAKNQVGVKYTGGGRAGSPLLADGVPFTGVLYGANYVNGIVQQTVATPTTPAIDLEKEKRKSAQDDFKASLAELGLADLAETVDAFIKDDETVANIKLKLPKTKAYTDRFPGMTALRNAGIAISEAQYISNERTYLQSLRAYGLDTGVLGSRAMLGKYIANSVAPREFEERIDLAVRAVDANPDVLATFKTFYPEVDKNAVATYLLNPEAGIQTIRKQVRTAEIGAAASKSGFGVQGGLAEFENLIAPVGTASYAQISTEFQRARQLANAQRRLAAIEGQAYSDMEAVQAVVGDNVPAILESQRRTAREVARFQQRGGVSATALTQTNI
jgi:hypothetical protein